MRQNRRFCRDRKDDDSDRALQEEPKHPFPIGRFQQGSRGAFDKNVSRERYCEDCSQVFEFAYLH
jgi:hypothetical protein